MANIKTNHRYDLVILGSGSAAFSAAIKASELGARVAMTDHGTLGGTCVNVGCIPSKNLIEAAKLYYAPTHSAYMGLHLRNSQLDFAALIRQKDQLYKRLRQKKYIDIAEGDEKTVILNGHAQFVSKNQVQVGELQLDAPKFLIATGSRACTHAAESVAAQFDTVADGGRGMRCAGGEVRDALTLIGWLAALRTLSLPT